MKTERVQSNTNFGNFYRIPNTHENAKFINEQLVPAMEKFEYPHLISSDRMPTANKIFEFFSDIAEQNGGSLNWLKNHARRYNVEMPVDNHEMITLTTGLQDAIKMKNCEINLLCKTLKNYLGMTAKMLFGIKSKAYIPGEPRYIEDIRSLTGTYNKQATFFDKFLEKNNAVKINNCEELTSAMINEVSALKN